MEMKPCPFCGNTHLEFQYGTEDREGIPTAVLCGNCGATGPWAYVRKNAKTDEVVDLWNSRIS